MKRVVQLPIYWVVVGFAFAFISPILSIMVSARVNERTVQEAAAAKETARTVAIQRYCRLFGAQADVYGDATTDVGRAARDVWLSEYRLSGCVPPK